jgi:hypothetical protein
MEFLDDDFQLFFHVEPSPTGLYFSEASVFYVKQDIVFLFYMKDTKPVKEIGGKRRVPDPDAGGCADQGKG